MRILAATTGCLLVFTAITFLLTTELSAQRLMIGVQLEDNTSVVSGIVANGPAQKVGIRRGDEILSIGDAFILQPMDMVNALRDRKLGDNVRLELRRGSRVMLVDLKLVRATREGQMINDDGQVVLAPSSYGLVEKPAPEFHATAWQGLPDHADTISIEDLKGKVVCMLFFQTHCMHSRTKAIPFLKRLAADFDDDEDVVFLTFQTAFDEFETNTMDQALELFEDVEIQLPLGQDGSSQTPSKMVESYNAPGTPWFVVVDRAKTIRYNDFEIDYDEALKLIKELKRQPVR